MESVEDWIDEIHEHGEIYFAAGLDAAGPKNSSSH